MPEPDTSGAIAKRREAELHPSTFRTTATNCSGRNGLMIQPMAPASLMEL